MARPPFRQASEYQYLVENIPQSMQELKQWVCWSREPSKDGIMTKIPRTPETGSRAKSNEPASWRTFKTAFDWFMRRETYVGLGFMITKEDPFFLIDLDHSINDESELTDVARDTINYFDTYTEVSTNKHGLHIIGQGSKPEGAKCRNATSHPDIEVYDSVRFVCMTGQFYKFGGRTIEPCQNELEGFLRKWKLIPEKAEKVSGSGTGTVKQRELGGGTSTGRNDEKEIEIEELDDTELVKRMLSNKKTGAQISLLWNGNTSDQNDDLSAADQALANHLAWWTRKDEQRIDRLFRQSGLMRDKWDRPDYRDRTVTRAIADTKGEGYTPKRRARVDVSDMRIDITLDENGNPTVCPFPRFLPELTSLTDLGNAEYFVAQYGSDLRYVTNAKTWLIWTGQRWELDTTWQVSRMAWKSIRSMYSILPKADPDKGKQLFAHIKKSEAKSKLDAMISLASMQPGIPISAIDMDKDPYLINCQNGTVNLKTGILQPHKKEDNLSKIIPASYYPDATASRWKQFLFEVFCGDLTLVDFAQRLCGYCLTGDTSEESVYILYGRGRCGKSKFVDALRHVMGDYIKDTPVTTFVERNDTNTADLASLLGARLVTATEAEENQSFNEGLLKRVSGRDPVTCRYLYCGYFTYVPTFKVLFATNDIPHFRAQSYAMQARIKIIPFRQRFYEIEDNRLPVKDQHILEKLKMETNGIFTWMVQGALLWQSEGKLNIPKTVKDEVANVFGQRDTLGEFIAMRCQIHPSLKIAVSKLWREYQDYCKLEGIPEGFKQPQGLSRNLTQRDGIEPTNLTGGARGLKGIGLITEEIQTNSCELLDFHEGSCEVEGFSQDLPMRNEKIENSLEKGQSSQPRNYSQNGDTTGLNFSDDDFKDIEPIMTGDMVE